MARYLRQDGEHFISKDSLRRAAPEIQREVMEVWFRQHYRDPAENMPHDSNEGGYVWVWGGPYSAQWELGDQFEGIVPEEVIEELAIDLEEECPEWAPARRPGANLFDEIRQISEFHENFSHAVRDIEELLGAEVDDAASPCLLRLLYVNVITALETYLSDAFIHSVGNSSDLMRKFIETTPDFKEKRISLSEIYRAIERVEEDARTYLVELVWHRLDRIRPMYKEALGIDFPSEMGDLFRAVEKRHDIVHRNGKSKDGTPIAIEHADVRRLIELVSSLVQSIEVQLDSA